MIGLCIYHNPLSLASKDELAKRASTKGNDIPTPTFATPKAFTSAPASASALVPLDRFKNKNLQRDIELGLESSI